MVSKRATLRPYGVTPRYETGDGQPISPARVAAATTASMMAARTPADSRARRPAAVVPPGEVTLARASAGGRARGQELGRAAQRLDGEVGGDIAGQTHEDAGVDERLGDQEHVGGPGARQAGDGVELVLGDPDDRADRTEDLLGPDEVGLGGRRTPGDGRCAHADERRRVGHGPDDRGATPGTSASMVLQPDAGRDREDPADAQLAEHLRTPRARTGASRPPRRRRPPRARPPRRSRGSGGRARSCRAAFGSTTATSPGLGPPAASKPPSRASPIFPPPTTTSFVMGAG